MTTLLLSLWIALPWTGAAQAHPVLEEHHPDHGQAILLSEAEPGGSSQGTLRELTGPAESKGIASIEPLGIVELGAEFPGMEGRQLRARLFTIEPGGIVGIHTHNQRPGYAYILSGRIIEHRNDTAGPITHAPGSIAMEKTGVTHWWENPLDEPVKALVVDIFTPEQK
jgi:quercetin dioxygenase-like cupin family protein